MGRLLLVCLVFAMSALGDHAEQAPARPTNYMPPFVAHDAGIFQGDIKAMIAKEGKDPLSRVHVLLGVADPMICPAPERNISYLRNHHYEGVEAFRALSKEDRALYETRYGEKAKKELDTILAGNAATEQLLSHARRNRFTAAGDESLMLGTGVLFDRGLLSSAAPFFDEFYQDHDADPKTLTNALEAFQLKAIFTFTALGNVEKAKHLAEELARAKARVQKLDKPGLATTIIADETIPVLQLVEKFKNLKAPFEQSPSDERYFPWHALAMAYTSPTSLEPHYCRKMLARHRIKDAIAFMGSYPSERGEQQHYIRNLYQYLDYDDRKLANSHKEELGYLFKTADVLAARKDGEGGKGSHQH